MASRWEFADTKNLLSRMVEAITAAEPHLDWPAVELSALVAEATEDRIWTLTLDPAC